jgi:ABC-type sugar transport system permease subunit
MIAQFQILASDGGPSNAAEVLTTYIYYNGFKVKDMGYASAVSVALFAIILVFTAIQQRLNRVDWGY